MLTHYILIGLGAAFGAMARSGVGKVLPTEVWGMPFSILCVNVLGCFLIGVVLEVSALHWSLPEQLRYFLIPGFLGGFTTFSTFVMEYGLLAQRNAYVTGALYVSLSFGVGIGLFFAGIKLVRVLS